MAQVCVVFLTRMACDSPAKVEAAPPARDNFHVLPVLVLQATGVAGLFWWVRRRFCFPSLALSLKGEGTDYCAL